MFVRVGEYDLATPNETLTNDIEVQELRSHEDFDPGTYEHDIAILKLVEPVKYSIYTQPICLPLPSQDFTNTMAIVSGKNSRKYCYSVQIIFKRLNSIHWAKKIIKIEQMVDFLLHNSLT